MNAYVKTTLGGPPRLAASPQKFKTQKPQYSVQSRPGRVPYMNTAFAYSCRDGTTLSRRGRPWPRQVL
eukprot:6453593-Prymnesium_polylepis.1